jgi:hypothetical protein
VYHGKKREGGLHVSGDVSMLESMEVGACILSWIPLMCAKVQNDEITRESGIEFVRAAQQALHAKRRSFYENSKSASDIYLTNEERAAVENAALLRDRELLGYHKALENLAKFLTSDKRSCILRAVMHYRTAEEAWRRLLGHMGHFVMTSLAGRRQISFF